MPPLNSWFLHFLRAFLWNHRKFGAVIRFPLERLYILLHIQSFIQS